MIWTRSKVLFVAQITHVHSISPQLGKTCGRNCRTCWQKTGRLIFWLTWKADHVSDSGVFSYFRSVRWTSEKKKKALGILQELNVHFLSISITVDNKFLECVDQDKKTQLCRTLKKTHEVQGSERDGFLFSNFFKTIETGLVETH